MGTGKGRMRKVTEMERKCGRFTTLLCQSAVTGDNLLLTAVPQLAEMDTWKVPILLCCAAIAWDSHRMDKSYQCMCFPKPQSLPMQLVRTAPRQQSQALRGREKLELRFSQSFMDVHDYVVFTGCVLPLPLAFGVGNQRRL